LAAHFSLDILRRFGLTLAKRIHRGHKRDRSAIPGQASQSRWARVIIRLILVSMGCLFMARLHIAGAETTTLIVAYASPLMAL
jgi:hypothetical protein